ncbi:uridine kinase [Galactobacter caseinivorans]|uniref:Uridine kinase n=1 Tax=Galactobacter caseinivorans TaxID=2676123 RepID=A0A496PH34_9MICC|nr:uridine kinase [Galactobacter caseinivorans]
MQGVSDPALPQTPAPLILLGGASGSGKSYLAARYGSPHLSLDDFYREASEDKTAPLPRTSYGQIDWDHPGTWNQDASVAGIRQLLETGETSVPNYSIADSAYFGRRRLRWDGNAGGGVAAPIVAEGIFAAEALRALRAAGVAVDAYYVDHPRVITALARFARDVREHRKPLPFLLQRGVALLRADPEVRRRHLEAGFVPLSKRRLKRALAAANSTR